jgi:hypothetical protein
MISLKRLYPIVLLGMICLLSACSDKCISGNCENGYGTYTFKNGNKYVGEWKDGKRNGQGTNTWPGGEKYIGEWKDNNMNGQGTYTYADDRIKRGIWKNNKFVKKNERKQREQRIIEERELAKTLCEKLT